ncbi:MAG: hypothetical protein GY679_02680 [Mycoplasma sp.]|nr:hypothetical protein [Mycoplasma sp.]
MKLENKQIQVKLDDFAQVDSITYKGKQLLYQGDEGWGKKFPIIFPSLGKSKGFLYENKKYNMPKHGWWKELDWQSFYEGEELLSVATILDKEKFPFAIDIVQRIGLDRNTLYINYEISNLDKKTAYFQFGIHPAFKIDDSSFIKTNDTFQEIDLEGKISGREVQPNDLKIQKLLFGKAYDTLISVNSDEKNIKLINEGEILDIKFDSPHIQIWKPKQDNFICIEPWYGWNDMFYNAPEDITKKEQIIKLEVGRTWSATFELKVITNKK